MNVVRRMNMRKAASAIRWSIVTLIGLLSLMNASNACHALISWFHGEAAMAPVFHMLHACTWLMMLTTTSLALMPLIATQLSQQEFVRSMCLLGATATLLVVLLTWSQLCRGSVLPQMSNAFPARTKDTLYLAGGGALFCFFMCAVSRVCLSWNNAERRSNWILACLLTSHGVTCTWFLVTLRAATHEW